MPLPHFLLLLGFVLFAAAVTIWIAIASEVPALLLGIAALVAAAAFRLTRRDGHDQHRNEN